MQNRLLMLLHEEDTDVIRNSTQQICKERDRLDLETELFDLQRTEFYTLIFKLIKAHKNQVGFLLTIPPLIGFLYKNYVNDFYSNNSNSNEIMEEIAKLNALIYECEDLQNKGEEERLQGVANCIWFVLQTPDKVTIGKKVAEVFNVAFEPTEPFVYIPSKDLFPIFRRNSRTVDDIKTDVKQTHENYLKLIKATITKLCCMEKDYRKRGYFIENLYEKRRLRKAHFIETLLPNLQKIESGNLTELEESVCKGITEAFKDGFSDFSQVEDAMTGNELIKVLIELTNEIKFNEILKAVKSHLTPQNGFGNDVLTQCLF